ncbi:hypothetical protein DSO57_1019783 [Entomophthora muscae]|uniref:Uncharacterized protein n=1 Tax=Entomophthora muscae TaxID=34485 RepID=A0ACC2UEN1_9FUNG|nr:hypothetical protein DSO57_1019783 [Entomophthora muscae]
MARKNDPRYVTGFIYKCTLGKNVPILENYKSQIPSLAFHKSDIYFLAAHYNNKQFRNPTMAKIFLEKSKTSSGIKELFSKDYSRNQYPENHIIRKFYNMLYVVLIERNIIIQSFLNRTIKRNYTANLSI